MRPFKHAAPDTSSSGNPRYQGVLGISLGRFAAPWGEVPLAATSEVDRVSLLYWNDSLARWDTSERPHEPLTADGDAPEAPAVWSWSDRVGIACSSDTVFLVYKRRPPGQAAARLRVDRFAADGTAGRLRRLDTVDFLRPSQPDPEIGRSLWCGVDSKTDELLILFQERFRPQGSLVAGPWRLFLARVRFAGVPFPPSWNVEQIGAGGFDLDACLHGRELLLVYRETAEATRIPLTRLLGQGTVVRSDPAADAFYEPLQLGRVDLDSPAVTIEAISGGEHPQIQRADPLLITFDRHHETRARLDTPVLPLPPHRPRVVWDQSRLDKMVWLRHNGVDSRGVLLTLDAALPRSLADFGGAFHLFDAGDDGFLRHALPFAPCPVSLLSVGLGRADLTLDVLHHRRRVGLLRTRVRGFVGNRQVTVSSTSFEVWDISHAQVGQPADLVADATCENAQFEPTGGIALCRSPRALVPAQVADNVMGGHVTADLSREPVGFFAYSDLGDGGLRVIFAPDIPELPEPPPVDNKKVLRPEQVTGPRLLCEQWVQLDAADWTASELPAYPVGIGPPRSLGSAVEVPIEFLLDGVAQPRPDGSRFNPLEGLTDADLDEVDKRFRLDRIPPRDFTVTASDGREVVVTVTPGSPVRAIEFEVAGLVGGAAIRLGWTFQRLDPAGLFGTMPPEGPLVPGAPGTTSEIRFFLGNPATVSLARTGQWRLSVFLLDASDTLEAAPGAAVDIEVGEAVRDLVWAPTEAVAESRFHRLEELQFSLFEHDIGYTFASGGGQSRVTVAVRPQRATDLRFRGGGAEQGTIEYRARLAANSGKVRLKSGLDLVFSVTRFALDFTYGRAFTPGMLMVDRRACAALTGEDIAEAPLDVVTRTDPATHAALGGKPIGNTWTSEPKIDVGLETNMLTASLAALTGALATLGLFALAATVAALFQLAALAAALGVAGYVLTAVVAAALLVLLVFALPRAAEGAIRDTITRQFEGGNVRQALDRVGLLRYAGEGMAEAIARKALKAAVDQGLAVAAPAEDADRIGLDRFRGQAFQTVFVSDGVCRVLLRLDRCPEAAPEKDEG